MRGLRETGVWRRGLMAAALAVPVMFSSAPVQAQAFPSKTIELVNLAGAGGGTDIFLRMLGNSARGELNQDVAVVSKQGGGGVASLVYMNTRARDGHTVLGLVPAHLIAIAQGKGPVKFEDLVPVVMGADEPIYMLARADGFKDAQALIDKARAGTVRVGGTSVGTLDWMGATAFARKGELKNMVYVPFRSGGEVVTNLVGGNIDVGLIKPAVVQAQIQSGELRPLLVLSGERQKATPDVPTARELGIDVVLSQTRGLAVLKGVPDAHVKVLEQAYLKGMESQGYQEYLQRYDLPAEGVGDAAAWGAKLNELYAQIQALVKE